MNKIKLIENLIKQCGDLPHRDEKKLDALKRRVEMIIRGIFGDSSKYLVDLKSISFYSMVAPVEDSYRDKRWQSGKSEVLNLLNTMLEEFKLFGLPIEKKKLKKISAKTSNKIFVVHGHDEIMKQSVARAVEQIGLKPVILHEKPDKGRTIIEKFTDYSDVSFAIVLLSPDDELFTIEDSLASGVSRARQNVIFELGFFIGKLGRNKVLVLYKEAENFQMPTDYSGVLYTPYDSKGSWKYDLVKELKACGFDIDANKLI